nr:protein NRT1/ PTR FAMILY 5.8-like [Ipomoea batatas]
MAGRRGFARLPCVVLLIVVAGMERFTFKGVASNMVTYLTEVVKMSNSAAAKMVNNWCGFTSLVPIVVAPVAESYLDRYTTILCSSFIYVLGLLALTSRALGWPWRRATNNTGIGSSLLMWSLPLISLGLGGFNASLQAFGADQLEEHEDDELPRTNDDVAGGGQSSDSKSSFFFQWWYFGVCCGCLLGVSVMSYIQDTIGWGLGFAVPTAVMLAAIALFLCGSRFYAVKNAREISIAAAIKTTVASTFKNCGRPQEKPNNVELQLQDHQNPLCDQDSDGAEKGINVSKMARVVLGLLPVWAMLLMFAVIFQQPATFFTRQGMTMKRNIGSKFMVPPAALQSAITISIVLLMPLYDKVFIPFIRAFTRNERGVTVTQRMGIGMFLSVVAMAIAALTENKRLQIAGRQPPEQETVAMSIFWLLPQYILLGISDIFTVVGMQEFFYAQVPVDMKTLGIALNTSVFGVGNFLGSFIISMIEHFTSSTGKQHGWFSDGIREGRLDKYYWLLALSSSNSWGVLSTLATDSGGAPFGNVVSFSDGLPDKGLGVPYFYLTTLDPTARYGLKDPRVSLTLSEYSLGTCGNNDPESPLCSKINLTGKFKLVDGKSKEADFARVALFTKHPEMKGWPKDHNFEIYTLEIEDIFLINFFGGPKPLTVDQYLKWKNS